MSIIGRLRHGDGPEIDSCLSISQLAWLVKPLRNCILFFSFAWPPVPSSPGMASLSAYPSGGVESCTPPNAYIYHLLRHAKSKIRLLQKHCWVWGRDPSKFDHSHHLQTIPISERPEFIAFSYTWGDSTSTKDIYCDGKYFHVPESISRVLEREGSWPRVYMD